MKGLSAFVIVFGLVFAAVCFWGIDRIFDSQDYATRCHEAGGLVLRHAPGQDRACIKAERIDP